MDNFEAENKQELSVSENEVLRVMTVEDNGWCICEPLDKTSDPGLVPLSYLVYIKNVPLHIGNVSVFYFLLFSFLYTNNIFLPFFFLSFFFIFSFFFVFSFFFE